MSDVPASVSIPLLSRWRAFSIQLPTRPSLPSALTILIEGNGVVWLDDFRLHGQE